LFSSAAYSDSPIPVYFVTFQLCISSPSYFEWKEERARQWTVKRFLLLLIFIFLLLFLLILLLLLVLFFFNLQRSDPLLKVFLRCIFTPVRVRYVRLHLHILWIFNTSTLNRTQTATEPVLIQIYGASGGRFCFVNESTYSLSI